MKIKLVSMALFVLLAAACSKDPPPKTPAHKAGAQAACTSIDGKAPKGECPPGCAWSKDHCVKKK
jgi:hypothetical protein